MAASWVPRVRTAAIVAVSLWALVNVLLADSASNHAQAVVRDAQRTAGVVAPTPTSLAGTSGLNKGVPASTFGRRIALAELLVLVIGVAAAFSLLTWQAGAAARLERVDPNLVHYGPGRVVEAWLVPGLNLVAPVRSLWELFAGTDPRVGRSGGWRVAVVGWWLACLAFVGLAVSLLARDAAGRDHTLVALGILGVMIAALSVALVVWVDARMRNREIPEPEHPWAGWVPLAR